MGNYGTMSELAKFIYDASESYDAAHAELARFARNRRSEIDGLPDGCYNLEADDFQVKRVASIWSNLTRS
jgi:hypothetical protein